MATSQRELALQMLAQLRMLDPSVSAEVGTPERKILDTVAQALVDVQVDLTQLAGALDIDTKYGSELENFLALFGFGRQTGTTATGFVTFSRSSAATVDIRIPSRTQVAAPASDIYYSADLTGSIVFETTYAVTLLAGQTSITAPIIAVTPGSASNVAAGRITQFVGTPIYGITDVTNVVPITGGVDRESDEELKIRFKNTVFRNLAGTQDQYLALAASTQYTTKANVVGPISRYKEYIQVPKEDDATAYNINPQGSVEEPGNGLAGEYTTALSDVPYSKHIYTADQNFHSNGQVGQNLIFYRDDIDWRLNTSVVAKNRGDAYRYWNSDITPKLGIDPSSAGATYKPSVTLTNVYTGNNDLVTAARPDDVILFEHSYMSSASRNDYVRNVTNCVDVYIDGENPTVASAVLPAPGDSVSQAFVNDPTSKYHYANYRLWGEPDIAPATWASGNTPAKGGTFVASNYLFIPLYWQPVVGLPSQIVLRDDDDESIFFLNEHYWLVYDNTDLFGTVRARNGLCFDRTLAGAAGVNTPRVLKALHEFTDPDLSFDVDSYLYDRNVVDLQATLETSKQVTTDILAHRTRRRYLKLDVTVMYMGGASAQSVNSQIVDAVNRYLRSLYFGSVVQLSDLLQAIHSVSGVDNVRWTSDIPGNSDLARVYETNSTGVPRGDDYVYATDFYVKDDELPVLAESISQEDADGMAAREFTAVPGLVIRTRAQSSFNRA